MTSLLLKGILIGFSIAMPVGPIGLLCIRNSLVHGRSYGFATGLGAAVADACYGAIAGFGVASLMTFLINYKLFLQIAGGFFLCYLGWITFFAKNETQDDKNLKANGRIDVFLSTFFLTLTNPMTILSFVGIYAGLGIGINNEGYDSAAILTAGVFLGSAFWWFLLSSGSALYKHKLTAQKTTWINKISGTILFVFGLAAFLI